MFISGTWDSCLQPRGGPMMMNFNMLQHPPALQRCPREKWYADDGVSQWNSKCRPGYHQTQSQKETCSSWHKKKKKKAHIHTHTHAQICWCQDHCGCAWFWYGWEAAVDIACLPVSLSKCIDAWACPTTWPSSPTWWSTMIRISQPVIWR